MRFESIRQFAINYRTTGSPLANIGTLREDFSWFIHGVRFAYYDSMRDAVELETELVCLKNKRVK